MAAAQRARPPVGLVVLLPFGLTSFAAHSLITRHVVSNGLFGTGLLSAVRFISGALALLGIALVRREWPTVGGANLLPALWLGVYAACISYGYRNIGAAVGCRTRRCCHRVSGVARRCRGQVARRSGRADGVVGRGPAPPRRHRSVMGQAASQLQ